MDVQQGFGKGFAILMYFALGAHEYERVCAAMQDYNLNQCPVRGYIYDGFVSEGTRTDLQEKHGLIQKPMVKWQDNFFMCLRNESDKGNEVITKLGFGRRMCLSGASSLHARPTKDFRGVVALPLCSATRVPGEAGFCGSDQTPWQAVHCDSGC